MTPHPTSRELARALADAAAVLLDAAHEAIAGTYTAAQAEQDRHALIAADLPGTLATWAQAHA